MSDFLESMAISSRLRAEALVADERVLKEQALSMSAPIAMADEDAFAVIAEIKRRSPAEGELATLSATVSDRAGAYAAAGASAVSVLTEPDRFDGSLADLSQIANIIAPVPAMRKDFLVDPLQLYEARANGASGVLLIAAILPDSKLQMMSLLARDLGLFVLLEAFDSDDAVRMRALLKDSVLESAASTGQLLFGVNTRDLRSLEVDPKRLEKLAPHLPLEHVCIAESGITSAKDAAAAAALGYRGALVGTALMRADDPAALVRDMKAAASQAV